MEHGYLSEAFVSFQGEGVNVGRRQLFLRFAGCPLRCRYCDTPASLVRTDRFVVHGAAEWSVDNPVSVTTVGEAVARLVDGAGAVDGTSLTGGEPLAQADFIASVIDAGGLPRPLMLETSGTMASQLARVVDRVDLVSMDLKLPSNSGEADFWSEHERFLAVAADRAYVKVLVDDGTAISDIERAARLVGAIAPATPVFVQPITEKDGRVVVSRQCLDSAFEALRTELSDVRVVPQTHRMMSIP